MGGTAALKPSPSPTIRLANYLGDGASDGAAERFYGEYGGRMGTYITLFKYRGAIEGGGPERFAQSKAIVEAENGKIISVYGLLGEYDILAVAEYPDTRAAMKASAKIGNLINAQSQTMAAVERDVFLQLLTEL
jgi:uncharacterized protein with GYD domain